jgi:membrane-bound ClpP family serine protease
LKRAIIGAAFFVGGAILLSAEANSGGSGFVLGFFGIGFGIAGMAILIYELTIKEKD